MAAWYLQAKGYRILQRNYRTPMGEIDLVAKDGKTLVFVEVKARRSYRFGPAKWPSRQRSSGACPWPRWFT